MFRANVKEIFVDAVLVNHKRVIQLHCEINVCATEVEYGCLGSGIHLAKEALERKGTSFLLQCAAFKCIPERVKLSILPQNGCCRGVLSFYYNYKPVRAFCIHSCIVFKLVPTPAVGAFPYRMGRGVH
jgi:hypothetical protein